MLSMPPVVGTAFLLLILSIFTFTVFEPVVFDWFAGDDYVHLEWLHRLDKDPQLILRNFTNNWLDIPTTSFYRPLVSISLAVDYFFYRENATGFHVTNILLHILCALFLYGIAAELTRKWQKNVNQVNLHALVTASIFALYPLHGETVCWITGRVDSLATVFITSSLWFYLLSKRSRKKLWLSVSLIAATSAYASKELAITIPMLIIGYECCISGKKYIVDGQLPLLQILKETCKQTWPFILLTVFYLFVRHLVLGTFVGGYNNSLLPEDWNQALVNWQRGLAILFLPINNEAVSEKNFSAVSLRTLLPLLAIMLIFRLYNSSKVRLLTGFYVLWLVVCFIPIASLFSIAPNLESSRMGYLMSLPLSGLLSLACLGIPAKNSCFDTTAKKSILGAPVDSCLSLLVVASLLLTYTILLHKNNRAWIEAGRETIKIKAAFKALFESCKPETNWLIINLPDNIKGAFVARNALGGLIGNSGHGVSSIQKNDIFLAQAMNKEKLLSGITPVRLANWNLASSRFEDVNQDTDPSQSLSVSFSSRDPKEQQWTLRLEPTKTLRIDYISVECLAQKPVQHPSSGFLSFRTELLGDGQLQAKPIYKNGRYYYVFPLRGLPAWTFGKNCTQLTLQFINGETPRPEVISTARAESLQPTVELNSYPGENMPAFVLLGQSAPKRHLHIDTSNLSDVHGIIVQLSRSNTPFSCPNGQEILPKETSKTVTISSTIANLEIDEKLIEQKGYYCLRAFAVGKDNIVIGQASDHINVLRSK